MGSLMGRSSDLFDDFLKDLSGFYVRPMRGEGAQAPGQIRLDVKEDEAAYTVKAEVPGVAKEDIQVSLDGNTLTIRAEVKQEQSEKQDTWLRSERYCGVCSRSFTFPSGIDEAQAKAKSDNGVLTLTLPKTAGGSEKRIAIE